MWFRARLARWLPFFGRYAEVAPACCNACRTCATTNLLTLAGMVGGAIAAPFLRAARLGSRRDSKTQRVADRA
jgi:hypothetical protein